VTPARLAARALELLGPVDGPIAVVGPEALAHAVAACTPVTSDGGPTAGAVVSFVHAPADGVARRRSLVTLRERLAAGAPLALVDWNQPRTWGRRVVAVAYLAARGFGPARGRYPAARELAEIGFRIERLRLAAGERLQLVLARR